MTTRSLHRVVGLVMLLPLAGWAITGAVFFLKPGYAGAYELLPVKTYPFETNIAIETDPSWTEARLVKTILGEHCLRALREAGFISTRSRGSPGPSRRRTKSAIS
jgi:hypothetical protein